MTQLDIEQIRRTGPREALLQAMPEQVASSLIALANECERDPYVDFDKLLNIGVFLSGTGHESSDEAVIDWFQQNPTAQRLDIAAALLYGLWLRDAEHPPVSAAQVVRLANARSSARTSPNAEYSFALAMSRVLEDPRATPDTARAAVQALNDTQARGTGDPLLDKQLALLIRSRVAQAQDQSHPAPQPNLTLPGAHGGRRR